MKVFFRNLVLCALPLLFAAGSGYYFTTIQGSCGPMVGSLFPVDVGQLVFWTKVSGAPAGTETTIHHVWFHGDTQVGDVELHVAGSPWRTWSRKTVPADWTGAWHVEVRDAAGTVVKRVDFTVGQ